MTVLIVDDEPSVRRSVRACLKNNADVQSIGEGSTGAQARQDIRRLRPEVVFLDIRMPQMDGFEVLSRIKNNPDLAQTRVILLTGNEQEMNILRGFSLGADDYVTKPFNPMELLMRLKRVIGRI